MEPRVDPEDEDYHYYGTPIEQEEETRGNQYRKDVKDPSATRALPIWKQEVTDDQGRRRFHGAFTGGFSAGYYNTVGSAEGWAPSTFRSSRSQRAEAGKQSIEQFLDEDELEEHRKTNLQTTAAYDTFGSTAAETARRAAVEDAQQRPAPIPGLLPEEVLAPVVESVGVQLLQRMGWRQGKGLGTTDLEADDKFDDKSLEEDAREAKLRKRQRRWGQHTTVGTENTPLHLVQPKNDHHGLGYDPFKGANEFREAKQRRLDATRPDSGGRGAGSAQPGVGGRKRGFAFGSGVLDEDDSFGILDDYVTHDDVESYMEEQGGIDAEGRPVGRGPRVDKRGLGDRLALKGYSYEIMDEEEGDDDIRPAKKRKEQLLLAGRDAPLMMLQSKDDIYKGSLIPGFIKAESSSQISYFPPPKLPKDYVPRCPLKALQTHTKSQEENELEGGLSGPEPPKSEPPTDSNLRQEIDRLAFFVARNGPLFENVARDQQRSEGRFQFLLPRGEGSAYYNWKVYSLRKLLKGKGGKRKVVSKVIGQRSAPLRADERGAILGEMPLPASSSQQQQQQVIGQGGASTILSEEQQQQQQPLARTLLNVAEADRARIQAMLGSNFVRGEGQDMLQPEATGLRSGLSKPSSGDKDKESNKAYGPATERPGGGKPLTKPITAADLSRPLQVAVQSGLPLRRIEEWRPVPLLCKRLNVPDPYKGRPQELAMSKFKTDYLALPETAAAVAKAAAKAAPGAEEFLLPPSVQVAMQAAKEAAEELARKAEEKEKVLEQKQNEDNAVTNDEDAAGMADAFLSSLAFGGNVPGDPLAIEAAAEQQEEQIDEYDEEEAPVGKPIDLFRAILLESDSSDEEESSDEDEKKGEAQPAVAEERKNAPTDQQQQGGDIGVGGFGFAKLRTDEGPRAAATLPRPTYIKPSPKLPTGDAAKESLPALAPPQELAQPINTTGTAPPPVVLDEAMQKRVKEALQLLKNSKRSKKHKKEKKKKDKDKKHKKDRHKQKRRSSRKHSDDSSSSDSE